MFDNQMLPEKSRETQLVARVAKRIIQGNMDLPEIRRIKWTVRVVVSFHSFVKFDHLLLLLQSYRIRILKMVSFFFRLKIKITNLFSFD